MVFQFQEYTESISKMDTNVSNDEKLLLFDRQVEALLGKSRVVLTNKGKRFARCLMADTHVHISWLPLKIK